MENDVRTGATELHDTVGLITGLLLGGLAGFGAMLLFAPQTGKNTRNHIKRMSTELRDRAAVTFDDLLTLSHYDDREILAGQHTPINYR